MNEAQWQTCTHPLAMLKCVNPSRAWSAQLLSRLWGGSCRTGPERQFRLFALACRRRVIHRLDPDTRDTALALIHRTELGADGAGQENELNQLLSEVEALSETDRSIAALALFAGVSEPAF